MAEKLEIQINAKDNASGTLSKLTGAIGKLGKIAGVVGGIAGIVGLAVGLKKLNDFTKESVGLADIQIKAEKQLEAVLKSTGQAAGLNANQLKQMASELQNVTTFGDEAIIGAQSLLLTFTNIGNKTFPRATKTILDMSTALGQDLKSSTIQLGKALNDPIKGVTALSRVGVSFTEKQKDMIKTLVESGDTMKAQSLILDELEKEFGGSAQAATAGMGAVTQLSNAWGDFKEQVGMFVIPILAELAKNVMPLVTMATTHAGAIFAQLQAKMQPFIAMLAPIFQTVTTAVSRFLTALQSGLGISGAFQSAIFAMFGPDVLAKVKEFFGPLFQALSSLWNQLLAARDNLQGTGAAFTGTFGSIANTVLTVFVPAITSIVTFLADMVNAFNMAAGGLTAWESFSNGMVGVFEFLKLKVFEFGQSMLTIFMNWLTGPGGINEQTPGALSTLLTSISTWLETTWPQIQATLQGWSETFWSWMLGDGGVVSKTDTVFTQLVDGLGGWIEQNKEGIGRLGQNIGTIIFDLLAQILSDDAKIGEVLVALTSSLIKNTPVIVDGLLKFGEGLASGIIDGIAKKLEVDLGPRVKAAIAAGLRGAGRAALSTIPGVNIASGVGQLLNFDRGGVVPGRTGQPTLAMVHGGEEILTPGQQRTNNDNRQVNITINSSAQQVEQISPTLAMAQAFAR